MARTKFSARGILGTLCGLLFLVFQVIGQSPATVSAALVRVTVQGPPSSVGQWSAPLDLGSYDTGVPRCAIHASLVPTGNGTAKVLFWGRDKEPNGAGGWIDVQWGPWQTFLWDPANGTSTTTLTNYTTDMFCSGHSLLPDGRLLVTGGHLQQDGRGDPHTNIFDPSTNTWSNGPAMNGGRWYPTTLPMGNGENLVVSGTDSNFAGNNSPQVMQTNGVWRDLPSAQQGIYIFYPWMLLAPNGRAFNVGPDHTTWFLATSGNGAWFSGPPSNYTALRDYGSAAMYDDGKVIIVGGGTPPTPTAEVINLSMNNTNLGQNPAWRYVGSMALSRRQMNLTILPDGKLLATGGTSGSGFCDPVNAAMNAEMWDPSSETWSTMAPMALTRLYHSTAILLPDGRVLSAGSGGNGGASNPAFDTTSVEFYSPPYLFNGPQPTITNAPSLIDHGQQFFVETPDATSISKVTLIRFSSVTHAFNQDQHINFLSFRQTTGGLNVTAPGSGNLCPPGYYMMFLVNSSGVPSVAKIVQVSTPAQLQSAIKDQRYFTRQHYYDFLLREADAGGLAFWTNQITQCGNDQTCITNKRANVSRAFWESGEFQDRLKSQGDPLFNPTPPNGIEFNTQAFVSWCYRIYLARNPDSGGLNFWTNGLNNCINNNPGNTSPCYDNTIRAFLASGEYINRFYKP